MLRTFPTAIKSASRFLSAISLGGAMAGAMAGESMNPANNKATKVIFNIFIFSFLIISDFSPI
jgi:hypothetical protein